MIVMTFPHPFVSFYVPIFTATFFFPLCGECRRVFIETVLANIDRRERLEKESLKRR